MVFTFVTFELHVLFHFTLVRCPRPRSTRCRRTSSTKRRAELSKTYMLVISNGKMVLMLVYVAVCSMLVAYEIALGVGRRAGWVGSDAPKPLDQTRALYSAGRSLAGNTFQFRNRLMNGWEATRTKKVGIIL